MYWHAHGMGDLVEGLMALLTYLVLLPRSTIGARYAFMGQPVPLLARSFLDGFLIVMPFGCLLLISAYFLLR